VQLISVHIMKKNSITFAGSIITDVVKSIEEFPQIGRLVNITGISRAVGGSAPNTSIDIKKIDSTVEVSVIGRIGNDDNGMFVKEKLNAQHINTEKIIVTEEEPTSFSDVMSMPSGERTFFCAKGANSLFSVDDVDIDSLDCEMLHVGYIMLLDKLDEADIEYGSKMARLLARAQARGIKTSVDVVSNFSGDYKHLMRSAIKYCDNLIINEIEICQIFDLVGENPDGSPNEENIRTAMARALELGVKERVIVHCKQAGYMLKADGSFTRVPSLIIPKELIKGSVGAGDAFCAGSLYGIMKGYGDKELLEFASATAATNLFADNSVDGILDKKGIEEMSKRFKRRDI